MKFGETTYKRRYGLVLIFAFLLIGIYSYGQDVQRFPYNISFRGTTTPTGVVVPGGSNSATFTTNGLRLTNATQQFGAVALDNVSFNSTNGIEIEFEYSMYDGTAIGGVYGDGLSVFLYDASQALGIGARGAGLGYAFNRTIDFYSSQREPGLNGAYLGIGFDEYGNFKERRFQGEARVNGIVGSWTRFNSHVTLRGAMHPTGLSGGGLRGLRNSGYPVLISQSTLHGGAGTHGHVLAAAGGTYTALNSLGSANAFDLRPGDLSTAEGDAFYRKAFITLMPHALGGFRVTVRVQHGTTITTVIDNYHYRTSFDYVENANANTSTTNNSEGTSAGPYATTHTLNAAIPASFKIGFGASTGGASQVHLIRDLQVSIPYMPEMGDDNVSACINTTTTFNPYTNDIVYNGSLTGTPTGGNTNTYIDFNSFRFEDTNGNQIGTATSYTQAGVGTWTYNPANGYVTFVPVASYVGTATVNYSVKGHNTNGGPFGQDIYRSETTTMSVSVAACPVDVAVNKMGPLSAEVGSTISYKISVSNNGTGDATNVLVTDPAVSNFTATGITYAVGAGTGGTAVVTPANITVANIQGTGINIDELPADAAVTFTITGTVGNANTVITNTAAVAYTLDTNPANNTSTVTTEIFECTTAVEATYTFDADATLALPANATPGINGGTIQLVYVLQSGTAIPGVGNITIGDDTQFTIPVTYTDMNNHNTAVDNQWKGDYVKVAGASSINAFMNDNLTVRFNILPTGFVDIPNSIYQSPLPALNTVTQPFPVASLSGDQWFTDAIAAGTLETIGHYNISIGNYPAAPAGYVVKSEQFRTITAANKETNVNSRSGFWSKPLINTEVVPHSTGGVNFTTPVAMQTGQEYVYRYSAYTIGTHFAGLTPITGLQFMNDNSITFAKKCVPMVITNPMLPSKAKARQ